MAQKAVALGMRAPQAGQHCCVTTLRCAPLGSVDLTQGIAESRFLGGRQGRTLVTEPLVSLGDFGSVTGDPGGLTLSTPLP